MKLAFALWLAVAVASFAASSARIFNVRSFGAAGDGVTLDTAAISKAIDQAHAAGGGQVLFPPGRYLSGTVHLRSRITIFLEAGARLVGTTNLNDYQFPKNIPNMPEAKWGKWHRALLLGENVEDVEIAGPGTIDGNKVFDPTGEEKMRGPHTILFFGSKRFDVRDVNIVDSANYAILFLASDDVNVRRVKFVGGWDGVHFRGAPDRWCRNVNIVDCEFYTGDDAIAGRYWENTVIERCIINSSCNGIRVIGPIKSTIINSSLFYGPGQQPHRSSGRSNMLSGIILQPGAWDATHGVMDDILVANNTMNNVASPVTIWTKKGNAVGRVTVSGLRATGVYRSALSVESWADEPITNVVFRNVDIEFAGGGTAEQGRRVVRGPGVDARALPAWGIFARHVENLRFEDVRLGLTKEDLRPMAVFEDAGKVTFDNVRYPRAARAENTITATNTSVIHVKRD